MQLKNEKDQIIDIYYTSQTFKIDMKMNDLVMVYL